jgi:hypothetical protein
MPPWLRRRQMAPHQRRGVLPARPLPATQGSSRIPGSQMPTADRRPLRVNQRRRADPTQKQIDIVCRTTSPSLGHLTIRPRSRTHQPTPQ